MVRIAAGMGRPRFRLFVISMVSRVKIRSSRQMAMAGGIFIPTAAPPIISPNSPGETGTISDNIPGSVYTAAVPMLVSTAMMQIFSRMRRTKWLTSVPTRPRKAKADQKNRMPMCIARLISRTVCGVRLPSIRHTGSAARAVRGASAAVTIVAMAKIGPIAAAPSESPALTRPIASENSPICGIVIPTRMAERVRRPARIDPTMFAATLPPIKTATTTSAGRI